MSYRDALDQVAREERFLRLTTAPSAESCRAFVSGNIERHNPHFVALAEGRVIGWCDICRETDRGEHHAGSLGMGVIAAWRGKGIGRRLIETAIAAADRNDFLRIRLDVYASNTPAIALYQSVGFEIEGRLRRAINRHGQYDDILIMARLAAALR